MTTETAMTQAIAEHTRSDLSLDPPKWPPTWAAGARSRVASALMLGLVASANACSTESKDAENATGPTGATTTLGSGGSSAQGSTNGAGAGSDGGADPGPGGEVGLAATTAFFWGGSVSWDGNAMVQGQDATTLWNEKGARATQDGTRWLIGYGGVDDFTTNQAELDDPANTHYELERRLADPDHRAYIDRLHSLGWKVYFFVGFNNYWGADEDFYAGDPWDDALWADRLAKATRAAAAAKWLGFDGIWTDWEEYSRQNGWHPTWGVRVDTENAWRLPGDPGATSEAVTRAKVKERGAQLMQALVDGFPDLELVDYYTNFHGGWNEWVQHRVNGAPVENKTNLVINWWDGMTSVPGYKSITFQDATFYKGHHVGVSWDNAFRNANNGVYAALSQPSSTTDPWGGFSNWAYACDRVFFTASAWVDNAETNEGHNIVDDNGNIIGNTGFSYARPPSEVAAQLAAFSRWGSGPPGEPGTWGVYLHQGWPVWNTDFGFHWEDYWPGLNDATVPGIVDSSAPTLSSSGQERVDAGHVTFTGAAFDDFAIRNVKWSTSSSSGACSLTYEIDEGYTKDDVPADGWHMVWTATVPAGAGESVKFTATDIHNLTKSAAVTAE